MGVAEQDRNGREEVLREVGEGNDPVAVARVVDEAAGGQPHHGRILELRTAASRPGLGAEINASACVERDRPGAVDRPDTRSDILLEEVERGVERSRCREPVGQYLGDNCADDDRVPVGVDGDISIEQRIRRAGDVEA